MHLLDANAFIEASRFYYAFDLAPGYWSWLGDSKLSVTLASIQAVKDEITSGNDALVDWAKRMPNGFWLPDTPESIAVLQDAATWANDAARPFTQAAVDEFMASADLRLVAQASAVGATVVTRETSDPNCKKRVKLPDACGAMGVRCVQPFEAYRSLGLRLV